MNIPLCPSTTNHHLKWQRLLQVGALSSSLFPLGPHIILETVTKSATKAANNKTRVKAGEVDAYMRVSPTDFSSQLVLTTH
jgi:hypothetical protein